MLMSFVFSGLPTQFEEFESNYLEKDEEMSYDISFFVGILISIVNDIYNCVNMNYNTKMVIK